jgi:hypothetical protein
MAELWENRKPFRMEVGPFVRDIKISQWTRDVQLSEEEEESIKKSGFKRMDYAEEQHTIINGYIVKEGNHYFSEEECKIYQQGANSQGKDADKDPQSKVKVNNSPKSGSQKSSEGLVAKILHIFTANSTKKA